MNPTELFEKLVESGINYYFCIASFHDKRTPSVTASVLREPFNVDTPHKFHSFDPKLTIVWLAATAAELYPQSEFAKWWRGHND